MHDTDLSWLRYQLIIGIHDTNHSPYHTMSIARQKHAVMQQWDTIYTCIKQDTNSRVLCVRLDSIVQIQVWYIPASMLYVHVALFPKLLSELSSLSISTVTLKYEKAGTYQGPVWHNLRTASIQRSICTCIQLLQIKLYQINYMFLGYTRVK